MFDIGGSELLVIAVLAILVVGPKELPGMLRTFGRMIGKLRRTADEFRKHFDDAIREAGGEEFQREMKSLKQNNPLSQIRSSIEDAARDPLETSKPATSATTQNANSEPTDNEAYDDLGPPPPPLPPRNEPTPQASSAAAGAKPQITDSPAVAVANPESDEENDTPRVNGAHGTAGQGL